MKSSIFWDVTPCIPLKVNHFPHASTLVSCLAYFSTLKMETIFSSEASVDFQQNIRHYIPEDRTLNDDYVSQCSDYCSVV
jgi:hypothetical protein